MIRENVIFHERLHDGRDLRKLDLRTDIERVGEVPLENKVVRCVGQRLDHYEADLSVVWIVSVVHTAGQLHG